MWYEDYKPQFNWLGLLKHGVDSNCNTQLQQFGQKYLQLTWP